MSDTCGFCGRDISDRVAMVKSRHGGCICENCAVQASTHTMRKMMEAVYILEKMLAETKKQTFSEYWGTDL